MLFIIALNLLTQTVQERQRNWFLYVSYLCRMEINVFLCNIYGVRVRFT